MAVSRSMIPAVAVVAMLALLATTPADAITAPVNGNNVAVRCCATEGACSNTDAFCRPCTTVASCGNCPSCLKVSQRLNVGARVTFNCYVVGESVAGNNRWLPVQTPSGRRGFIADHYVSCGGYCTNNRC